jgi:hypothetical protein
VRLSPSSIIFFSVLITGILVSPIFFQNSHAQTEDCIGFNPSKLKVDYIQGRYKIVEGSNWLMDFGNNKAEATTSLQIIQKYGFNQQCFVGRPDPSMQYFLAPTTSTSTSIDLRFKAGEMTASMSADQSTQLVAGQPMKIYHTAENAGNTPVGAFCTSLTIQDQSGRQVSSYNHLTRQTSTTHERCYDASSSASTLYGAHHEITIDQPGTYTATMKLDYKNQVTETNEQNNINQRNLVVGGTTQPTGQPDLIVEKLYVVSPQNPDTDDLITINAVVKNVGTAQAPSTTLEFRIGGESPGPNNRFVSAILNPGETWTKTRQITLGVAQNYQTTAIADVLNAAFESNENNNVNTLSFSVTRAAAPASTDSCNFIHTFSQVATTQPNIDGIITSGEWPAGRGFTIDVDGTEFAVFLRMTNDNDNLYGYARIEGPQGSTIPSVFTEWFDNDGGCSRQHGDDYFSMYSPYSADNIGNAHDGFWNVNTNNNPGDDEYGGTHDGYAVMRTDSTTEGRLLDIVEFTKPLCSNDNSHDFCVGPGDDLGFFFTRANDGKSGYSEWIKVELQSGGASGVYRPPTDQPTDQLGSIPEHIYIGSWYISNNESDPGAAAVRVFDGQGQYVRDFVPHPPADRADVLWGAHHLEWGTSNDLFASSNSIMRYDSTTGALVGRFVDLNNPGYVSNGINHNAATDFHFLEDGKLYVFSPSMDVRRYSASTGAFLDYFIERNNNHGIAGSVMEVAPNGKLYFPSTKTSLLAGSVSGILIFDRNGNYEGLISPQGHDANDAEFGPDGYLYVSEASEKQQINVYDVNRKQFVRTFYEFPPNSGVTSFEFSSNNMIVIYDGWRGKISLLDSQGSFAGTIVDNVYKPGELGYDRVNSATALGSGLALGSRPSDYVPPTPTPPTEPDAVADNPKNIPQWIINDVCWWSEGQISDSEYIQTAQYLVSNGFIDDVSRDATISSSVTIPPWHKNNAGWWCAGEISYDDFEQGIQYLVRESQVTSDASDQQTEISPEPTDLLSISTDKSSYKAGDMVTIRASMSNPSRVAILITDPEDYAVLTRTITPPNTVQFKAPDVAGTYTISATSEVNGITITDTETFVVTQSGSTSTPSDASVVIRSVTPIDQQGNPVSSFNKGRTGFVKVVVTADSEVEALVTVNLFDSDLTSLGVGAFKTELQPGTPQEIQMSFFIPDDASVGLGTIFANALSDWPAFEGVPLSDEAESEVIIR